MFLLELRLDSCEELLLNASTPEYVARTLQTDTQTTDRRICNRKDPNVTDLSFGLRNNENVFHSCYNFYLGWISLQGSPSIEANT